MNTADVSRVLSLVDESRAVELLLQLLAIPGRSRQEGAVLQEIQRLLISAGLPESRMRFDAAEQRIPGGGEVGNLIISLPGTFSAPRRLLMAHVDTVPLCVGTQPHRDGDRIISANPLTGLGGDDRTGTAVLVMTLLLLQQHALPHPPLTFLFCVQEEVGLYGARYVDVAGLGNPEMGFNFDGDDPAELCLGATGDYALTIEITGIASHAGVHPECGVSAAIIAALALAELQREGWHGLVIKDGIRGTSNVGVMQGGEATNVVLPKLLLKAEARSHDPAFRSRIVDAYRQAFRRAVEQVRSDSGRTGQFTLQADLQYEAFKLSPQEPAVRLARAAVEQLGLQPLDCIANGGLDANWLVSHGIPTVTLGCGQHEIHTEHEWISIPEFLNGCRLGLLLATLPPGSAASTA